MSEQRRVPQPVSEEAKAPEIPVVPETISVIVHTAAFRGDHAADIRVAHTVNSRTTIRTLLEMLGPVTSINYADWIEIPAQGYRFNVEMNASKIGGS